MRSVEEIIKARGWTATGKAAREGQAWRVRVELSAGAGRPETGLLYVWDEPGPAERVVRCHQTDRAAQLFAVPEIIASGPGWCVMKDLDGVPLRTWLDELAPEQAVNLTYRLPELIKQAGTLLRKLHEVRSPGLFGEVLDGEEAERETWRTFNGFVAAWLDRLSEAVNQREFPETVRTDLLNAVGALRHELSVFHPRHPASLNHGKFSFDHIWVDPTGREVIGLTGFEHATYLPPEADVAYLLWVEGIVDDDQLVRAFYQGYGAARTMDVQRRERFYCRLTAFLSLFGHKGDVRASDEALVSLLR